MSDLWDKESLRGLYHYCYSDPREKLNKEAKSKGLGFFARVQHVGSSIREIKQKRQDIIEKFDHFDSFICPHCLKTIMTEEIELTCPFCNKQHSNPQRSQFTKALEDSKKEKPLEAALFISAAEGFMKGISVVIAPIIFEKCSCNSMIQYINCYHCEQPVNLFSKYDYDDLMRKRYGR
jgi:hypothetical protein